MHEMETSFFLAGSDRLATIYFYANSANGDLRIQTNLEHGELDMNIEAYNIDDLLHHAMLMGEGCKPGKGRRLSVSLLPNHGDRKDEPAGSVPIGQPPEAVGEACELLEALELLGALVEVVHEPQQKPDLLMQIVGWVNPPPVQKEVCDLLGEAFQQRTDRHRFD